MAKTTPATSEFADWDRLRRPLDLPTLDPGVPCPRIEGSRVSPQFGFGLGAGPAYPTLGPDGVLDYGGERAEGGWFYAKVLWFATPDYADPIFARGRQLGGPNEVRFDRGAIPPAERRLAVGATGRDTPASAPQAATPIRSTAWTLAT